MKLVYSLVRYRSRVKGHFLVGEPLSRRLLTVPVGPVVVEPVPDLLVDGRHGLHVALPPLAAQILGLDLEQLEDVELHHGLLHLQSSLQDGGRLEDHQHLDEGQTATRGVKYEPGPV